MSHERTWAGYEGTCASVNPPYRSMEHCSYRTFVDMFHVVPQGGSEQPAGGEFSL